MSRRQTRSSYLKNSNKELVQLDTYSRKKHIKKEVNKVKTNYFLVFYNFTYKYVVLIVKVSGVYLLWIFLHFVATHLYVKFCVPKTVMGFIMSPFMTATPHCQGLRWVVYNAASTINNMWIILGTWLCSIILTMKYNNTSEQVS
jgi:hypothetical protein